MTDAQMLQNLLAVYESLVVCMDGPGSRAETLKEVIAELQRRIAMERSK